MSKREAFLEAAGKENVDDFLHFIELHRATAEPFDVEEVVQEMPSHQREALWSRLDSLLQNILKELPPQHSEEQDMEQDLAQVLKHASSVVDAVTLVAAVSVKTLQEGDTYNELLKTAHTLHELLELLPASGAPLQLHIQTLYVAWWKKGLQDKEKFGRAAFLISLQKSFTAKKTGNEIQRVWSLHDVLLSLDHTSDDNQQIKELLLQCFQRPAYIRSDDGKRFLVFLFSWNLDFIWAIHGTIKNQLEFCNKNLTTHITEIYFRAWKKARGDFLERIESVCIQDLMQNAILLHRTSPVYGKVREIVSYFHTKKRSSTVDKMLHDLYKPILWKALNAANFEVRANATFLFTEAFPVHDPEQSKENIDMSIQKQLDTVMGLLDDPHPTVRSSATLGVCKILAKYWELLPPAIITDFLKKLVTELAADSSSPDVRCSVFKCLPLVLDNHLSHPLLEKLLPTSKYSLHDNSEKVRIAFLDMLIKVKAVRAAKFWDVCSMDHLMARLAIDSQSVSKRIVDLLFKSFFPVNESEKEWCSRCITLIQMNPMAARKFYQFAYKHTAPTNIIKLMLVIRRSLNSCIQVNSDMMDINDSNKENSIAPPVNLGQDMALVAGLLEVVVILWRSVEKALKHNEEAYKYTSAKFGNVMSKYFQAFEDERATSPLIKLASFLPPAAVPTFSCGVLSRLRKMDSGASPAQYSQLLDCICSWGQAADILELITDWLSASLPKQAGKEASRRKVRIQESVEAKPDLALAYLEDLFSHTATRDKVLALGEKPLKQLHTVLGNWKSVLYSHLSSTTEIQECPSVETALKAFTFHGRLGAHLQHNSFLTVCRDVILVDLSDEKFYSEILHLCSIVLLSDGGYQCIPAVLLILKEVASSKVPEDKNPDQENEEDATAVILGVVANIFQKIIEVLAKRVRKDPDGGKQLCLSAVTGMRDFLQVAQTWDREPLSGVLSTLFAIIIVENRRILQKIAHPEEVIAPQSVDEMPPLSNTLLSVILKSAQITKSFLTEVGSSLDSEAISNLTELAAVLHVLAVIKGAKGSEAGVKSAAVSIQQQIHKHAISDEDGGEIQRAIYDSSVKTLNEILHL
uniref:Non-SMC condensin II complex, subunit G2 n=1 Tax=Oryzias melastigma TaxID=30732 RepID=A0A3B3BD34_ORYME